MAEKKKAPPLEKVIVASIVKALKKYGVQWLWKTHGNPYQTSGVPDILCIAPGTGRFVGIEVKRPDGYGKATPLQLEQIERIRAAGGVAGIATSPEEALALVEEAQAYFYTGRAIQVAVHDELCKRRLGENGQV